MVKSIYKLSTSKGVATTCAIGSLLLSALALIGWQFHIPFLTKILPGFITMKANTAIGLCLFSVSLLLFATQKKPSPQRKIFFVSLILLGSLIGLLTICEYAFGWNLHIDEYFYKDTDVVGADYPAGRLAPITALSFLLLGAGAYLGLLPSSKRYRLSQSFFFVVALISFQAIVSYSLGIQTSFGIAAYMRIAINTAICLVLLCVGFLSIIYNEGFMRIVFSNTQSGFTGRRLIFVAIIVPPVVSFLENALVHLGIFGTDFATLFRIIASMIFFVGMVVQNSEHLYWTEEGRKKAEAMALSRERESARLVAESDAAKLREASEAALREELIRARENAERAAKAKAEFLANMSHEIRTPLNGIIGITDLLVETELNALQKKYAETIQISGNALLTVINDVLDFSKIEAQKVVLENIDFNLQAVVLGQVELLHAQAHKKKLKLTVSFDSRIPSLVNGDAGRIGQVLLNLISNAIKFTSAGSVAVHVSSIKLPDETKVGIEFAVEDTGIGMSEETQEKLFQPFAQADSSTSRKFGGTGLGLSISRSLVSLMGGKIQVSSAVDKGARFSFMVVLNNIAVTKNKPEETLQLPKPESILGKNIRVLVAEDSIVNQMVVLAHLKQLGCECQAVANGLEVISALKVGQFDLILMDCQMPEMDGFEATEKIREGVAGEQFRSIPIIALTANAFEEDRKKCFDAGMNSYLAKPYRRAELAAVMKNWFEIVSKAS